MIIPRTAVVASGDVAKARVAATGQTQVVDTSDSLAGNAVLCYGGIKQVEMLLRANAAVLPKADQITDGQELVIPAL